MNKQSFSSRKHNKGRGLTKLLDISKNIASGEFGLVVYNEHDDGVNDGGQKQSRYEGSLVRSMIPINYKSWNEVPLKLKDKLWDAIKVRIHYSFNYRNWLIYFLLLWLYN